MNAPRANDDFREQMSAWHDGELPADAARFVARRVLADLPLRDEVARWQLAGDVLRRRAVVRPSAGLPARVAEALDREAGVAATPPARSPRWMAVAAVLLVGIGGGMLAFGPADTPPDETRMVSTASAAPAPIQAPAPAITPPAVVAPRVIARDDLVAHAVPELVRAPQPTPEQLAPLPAVDPPSRPWPRGHGQDPYVVDYRLPPAGR